MKKILSLIAMMAMLPCAALADISWTNASSGYWTNGLNWQGGEYPGQTMTNNAAITNGVPSVTLDRTLYYFIPTIILSNTEFRVTNTVDTGTTLSDIRANGKVTVMPGSLWKCLIPAGATYFSGTNVSVEVRSNATWEASEFRLGRGTIGGDYRVFGGGTLDLQVGAILCGQTNTVDLLRSADNFVLIDGMTFKNAYPQVGERSTGNTLVLSNTTVTPPPVSVSYRAGSVAPCSSNTLILTGPRTVVDTRGAYCYVPNGTFSTGCVLRIENGATLTNSYVVNYAMGVPQANNCQNNSVLISSGGRAFMGAWAIGTTGGSHSNLVSVSGSGSMLDITGWWNMTVGNTTTTGNTLRVSDGGDVRGVFLLTVHTNSVLDFTKGRISSHDFTYYPTNQYVLGSNCTFVVESGATPTYEGVWSFNGGLLVDSNATLRGRGIVRGAGVTITNGATVIGSKEGTLTFTNMVWAGGAKFVDKIQRMGSRAGGGRSCLFVRTNLTFVASSPNYGISLDSDGDTITDFVPTDNYVLKFVDATTLTGYDPTKWTINTNGLLLSATPTAPWVITNFAGKLFVTYTGTPEDDTANGQTWGGSNGNWSVASNWTNNNSATSGVGVVLEFSGSGTNRYYATNDVAGTFDLYKMLITSASTATNIITGNPIRFNGSDAGIFHRSGGATVISNALSFASNAVFWGTESLEGSVAIATNMTVSGDLRKTGKWTLIFQGSNTIGGSVVVDSRGGGGVQLDSLASLSSGNVILSNGIISRTTATMHTFGNSGTIRNYQLTGPGSLYQLADGYTIGSNAVVTVTNQAQLRAAGGITVNGSGSMADPFHICGGEVYSTADSFIGNSNNNNRVTIHGGGLWDLGASILYVGSGTGTNNVLTLDDGRIDGGPAVYAGGKIGVAGGNYNGILLTNNSTLRLVLGTTTIGPLRIGSGIGSSYNWLDIKSGSRVISVQGGGSGRTIIGYGSNSTGNWIRADGGVIDMTQDQNSSGAYIAYNNGTGGNSIGNHLDIVNGGFVRFSRSGAQQSCYIYCPASAGANSNYIYVAGANSTYDAQGQPLVVGVLPGNTGNYIRVENGGLIGSADGINVGTTWSTACTDPVGNYLSVSNGTVYAGVRNGGSYVGGSFRGQRNYIEIVGTNSLLHHPTALSIGGGLEASSSNNVDNYVLIDGATVLHPTTVRIGNGTNDHRNYLSVTNGASFQSSGSVSISNSGPSRLDHPLASGIPTSFPSLPALLLHPERYSCLRPLY